jgi:hypothetical protein
MSVTLKVPNWLVGAEGEIRSWPVTVVQLQSAVVSYERVTVLLCVVLDIDGTAHKVVCGLVN